MDEATDKMQRRLIDSRQAAAYLGISERTLFTHRKSNAIPAVKIVRLVRYVVAELDAWIAAGGPTHENAADEIRREMYRGAQNETD